MSTKRLSRKYLTSSMKAFLADRSNEKTRKCYEADLASFSLWLRSQHEEPLNVQGLERLVLSLTHETLQDFQAHLIAKKLAARTINRKANALRSYFKWLVKQGQVKANPTTRLKFQKVERDLRTVSPADVESLFSVIPDNPLGARDRAMFMILADHRLRIGSLTGLNFCNLKEVDGRFVLEYREVRGSKTVNLSERAGEALHAYLASLPLELRKPESPLFINKLGTRLSGRSFRRKLEKYAKDARLSTTPTPRLLRRTALAAA